MKYLRKKLLIFGIPIVVKRDKFGLLWVTQPTHHSNLMGKFKHLCNLHLTKETKYKANSYSLVPN
jgi:hypothetical protein